MRRAKILVAGLVLLISGSAPALASCSNEAAHAMAQQSGAVTELKMNTKPDEMSDLASEFGDVISSAADGVSDKTCTNLYALVKTARAL